MTESGENNTAVIGDLYIGCRILKPLAADIALVVCLVAVFGAGGSLSRNRCQAVSCKRQVRNSADLVAILIEELSAVVALGIGFPTLFCTGGSLGVNICLVSVGARCRHNRNGAECGFFTRSCGNNSRTGSNCSNFTGAIDGCNIASAGIPGYGVSGIGRFNCGNQCLAFAHRKLEGALVQADAGCGLRSGSNIYRGHNNLVLRGVVFPGLAGVKLQIVKTNFECSAGVIIDCALEGCQHSIFVAAVISGGCNTVNSVLTFHIYRRVRPVCCIKA